MRVEALARPAADPARLPPPVRLRPGQRLSAGAAPDAPVEVAAVDPGKALAWEGGQIVVEEEPLSEVVARVNRYSRLKVEVPDPQVAARRISGVFLAGDVATFVDAVSRHLSLEPVRAAPDRIELRPAA